MPKFSAMVLSAVLLCGLSAWAGDVTEDPIERQMLDIAKDLRCAVCQNEPVSDSKSDLATDMRAIIREKLEAGESREQIVAYFVERYGNYVLLKPPYQGTGTVLWVMPLLLLAVVGGFAFVYLRSRSRRTLPATPELSEEDKARIRAAREEVDS